MRIYYKNSETFGSKSWALFLCPEKYVCVTHTKRKWYKTHSDNHFLSLSVAIISLYIHIYINKYTCSIDAKIRCVIGYLFMALLAENAYIFCSLTSLSSCFQFLCLVCREKKRETVAMLIWGFYSRLYLGLECFGDFRNIEKHNTYASISWPSSCSKPKSIQANQIQMTFFSS